MKPFGGAPFARAQGLPVAGKLYAARKGRGKAVLVVGSRRERPGVNRPRTSPGGSLPRPQPAPRRQGQERFPNGGGPGPRPARPGRRGAPPRGGPPPAAGGAARPPRAGGGPRGG